MMLQGLYRGVGESMGAIVSGQVQTRVGTVRTFIYAGCTDVALVCLALFFRMLQHRNKQKEGDKTK
jgi:hypothetical protein